MAGINVRTFYRKMSFMDSSADSCMSIEYELDIVNAKLNAAYVYMKRCNQRLTNVIDGHQDSWSESNADVLRSELRKALDSYATLKSRKDNLLCLFTRAVWDQDLVC
jgi:hypothetical protein